MAVVTVRAAALSKAQKDGRAGVRACAGLSSGFVLLHRTSWGCRGSLGSFSCRCMRRCGGLGRPGQHCLCICPALSSCGVSLCCLVSHLLGSHLRLVCQSLLRAVTQVLVLSHFHLRWKFEGGGAPKMLKRQGGGCLCCFLFPVTYSRVLAAQRQEHPWSCLCDKFSSSF